MPYSAQTGIFMARAAANSTALYYMPVSSWIIWTADSLEQSTLLLLLVPLVIAVVRWRFLPRPLRVLTAGLACLIVCLAFVLALRTAVPNEGDLWHIYTLAQTIALGSMYYYALQKRLLRQSVVRVLAGFVVFALLDWMWLERGKPMFAYTHTLQSVVLLSFGGLYFYQLARSMPVVRLENDPLFLVTSGIVMYFSGTVLLYVYVLPLISPADELGQHTISLLVSLVSVLQYSLFALAFYRADRFSSPLSLHE